MATHKEGSMKPKIQACLEMKQSGIDRAAIAHLTEIEPAVNGNAGTQFHL